MALRALVGRWKAAVRAQVIPRAREVTRTDAEGREFSPLKRLAVQLGRSPVLARATRRVAAQVQEKSRDEFVRLGIKLREAEPLLAGAIERWRRDNVGLITNIFEQERQKFQTLLAEGEGRRFETIQADIEERLGMTERRAELIARDQVLKLNGQITHARQTAAGIERYIWTTAGDERVREMHAELDGETFSWDDPPVTNEDGDTNHPGEDYQCRCVAYPVLAELAAESDEDEDVPAAAE